ncbi:uncharacterized protein LOC105262252 [Musca domestica]|uniref:Uncharacterized protein LOC105262252 n=1 Tax=Musca domestica TaxID=7370 RepID=A0A1I8NK24_MUSDO|nr:uncharacterized protein LOC105262252 [Musca domestica]
MFHNRVCLGLAAFLVIIALTASPISADDAAAPTPCKGCSGEAMMDLIGKFEVKRKCWFDSNHHVIMKLKLWNLIALVEDFKMVITNNNAVVAEECKKEVALEKCDITDTDTASECLMENLKIVVAAYRDQEACHGKAIRSRLFTVAKKLLFGSFVGWGMMHPDC